MNFRIADSFTDSLTRLTGEEQKAVKTTAFDLQLNAANPGMSFHKVDRAKDKHFWSVRVSSDIRLIVHKTESDLLLCYVDHHDKAYAWAQKRKLERHPKTGAAQLVEIRETVKEIIVPVYIREATPAHGNSVAQRPVLSNVAESELLDFGVPEEWIGDVKSATEDSLLSLVDHLPAEAAEAVLELATGGTPRVPGLPAADVSPFDHPDAQRRFRIMNDVEELKIALEYPWEKWTVFLHPEQRQWVERDYNGPARVSGSAGTGKTIVALHRAAHLARAYPNSRILLTTFSDTLANALQVKLRRLIGSEPRLAERIDVYSINAIGLRLYKSLIGQPSIVSSESLREVIQSASDLVGEHKFNLHFLLSEWTDIVDAWQLEDWDSYRDVARLGRKTRLIESQRKVLWEIFNKVRIELKSRELITMAGLFRELTEKIAASSKPIFDFAIMDESQDLSVAQLKFLAALGGQRPNALFFAGDLGQRIFQQPFSWRSLGVEIRGRSRTLRVNYRTSHQIRSQADRLLGPTVRDVDGNEEDRSGTVSVFNGPPPSIQTFARESEESSAVGDWIAARLEDGLLPHEIGLFVRSTNQLDRAKAALQESNLGYKVLDENLAPTSDHLSLSTMHLAKGLEFKAVVVMACDDEIIPLQSRIETITDDSDLQEVYDTERHLLYVACTRARDHLLVTAVDPGSEFLDDMTDR